MSATLWPKIAPVLLLLASNVFMTFAWYGHLKHKGVALPLVILVSWLIALPEYALAVPANRIGSAVWSAAQLKTIQEVITLLVFVVFSVLYLGEPVKWSTLVGFVLIAAGAGFVFLGR
ncbi:MAG: DMT family protein [Caulobacter sp.]|nr:DMT family protein [Caulobacter sp.]